MEQEEKLSLDFGNGEIYEVWLEVATYPADKNIKVCVFTEKEEEIWKLFELTTDMGIPLEKNQTFLLPGYDLEQIVEFVKKNGLGQLKEEICCSGCMEYPLFEFQEETLKKLDPEGYAAYEQAYQERGEVKNPEFQKEIKTADFQWAYGTEELALRVDYYAMNQNLYVELYSKEDGAWEPFSDLTVNLPGYCLEPGTACISGDFSKENIQFIQEHGLGTLLPWKAQSGMGQYAVVKFHLEELRKFDQAGVAAFCNQHGLQKTMQEERRQSRYRRLCMEIELSEDLQHYKESLVLGLTAKQFLFSALALGVGTGIVLLLYEKIGITLSCYVATPFVVPLALGFITIMG